MQEYKAYAEYNFEGKKMKKCMHGKENIYIARRYNLIIIFGPHSTKKGY